MRVCACVHACMCVHTCEYVYVHACRCTCAHVCLYVWRPDSKLGCRLSGAHYFFLFLFKTGSFLVLDFVSLGWPVSPEDPPVSTFPALGSGVNHYARPFYMGEGNQTQVLVLGRQVFYCLSYHARSPNVICLSGHL